MPLLLSFSFGLRPGDRPRPVGTGAVILVTSRRIPPGERCARRGRAPRHRLRRRGLLERRVEPGLTLGILAGRRLRTGAYAAPYTLCFSLIAGPGVRPLEAGEDRIRAHLHEDGLVHVEVFSARPRLDPPDEAPSRAEVDVLRARDSAQVREGHPPPIPPQLRAPKASRLGQRSGWRSEFLAGNGGGARLLDEGEDGALRVLHAVRIHDEG